MADAVDRYRVRRQRGLWVSRVWWASSVHLTRFLYPLGVALGTAFLIGLVVLVLRGVATNTTPTPALDLTSPDAVANTAAPHATPLWPMPSPLPNPMPTFRPPSPVPAPVTVTVTPASTPEAYRSPLAASPLTTAVRPVGIQIPAIGVASRDVAPLDLKADHTLRTPPLTRLQELGWYRGSPVPGDTGPAVVEAHVNGGGHPGLFANLDQVTAGDEVDIARSDGQIAVFSVTRILSVAKTDFPTQEVYGDTPGRELRLITCGGVPDLAAHRYLGQTIVFATLVGMRPTNGSPSFSSSPIH